jgi:CRP-like cAMP-binding protein
MVGGTFESITGINAILNVLHKITPFKVLSGAKLMSLASHFETVVVQDDFIFEEGDVGDCLYIVQEGSVVIYKNS